MPNVRKLREMNRHDEPGAPEATETDERRSWFPTKLFAWMLAVVLVLVVVNQLITLNYYVLAPGGARPVNSAIELAPEHAYPPKGKMLYTTVSLIQAHPFDIVWSQFDSQDEIRKKREVIGNQTPQEFLEQSTISMDESRMMATAVAMRKAGFDVTQQGDGAEIKVVNDGTPAAGKLNAGEVITSIDSKPVKLGTDVTQIIRATPVGTTVKIDVRTKDNAARSVDVTTVERPETPAGQPKISFVGIAVQTSNPRLDTPFPVSVNLGEVGGPSAGLAMSIALLDELTPGELTGGKEIATTGTIDLDGNVGEVGGVKQKVAAVRRDSKARLFLVPRNEEQLARQYAGKNLKVVGVDNLDQAVQAIIDNGGEKLQPARS